jgi:hypothetical protein
MPALTSPWIVRGAGPSASNGDAPPSEATQLSIWAPVASFADGAALTGGAPAPVGAVATTPGSAAKALTLAAASAKLMAAKPNP